MNELGIPSDRASSAIRYAESLKAKMEELMASGDAADLDESDAAERRRRGAKNRHNPDIRKRIDKESQEAAEMIANGMSRTEVAARFNIGPSALQHRLQNRGLCQALTSRKDQATERKRIDAAAREVRERANELGSISAALRGSGITEHQYQSARARLGLPAMQVRT